MNRNDDVPSHAADDPQRTPLGSDGPTVHNSVNSTADDTATQIIPTVPDPASSALGSVGPAEDSPVPAEDFKDTPDVPPIGGAHRAPEEYEAPTEFFPTPDTPPTSVFSPVNAPTEQASLTAETTFDSAPAQAPFGETTLDPLSAPSPSPATEVFEAAAAQPVAAGATQANNYAGNSPAAPHHPAVAPHNPNFTPPVAYRQAVEAPAGTPAKKKSRKGLIITLVVILVLVAAGAGGWVWWRNYSSTAHDKAVSKIEHAFGTAAGTLVYATGVKNSVGDSGVNTQELDRLLSSAQSTVDGILYLTASPINLPDTAVSVSDPYTASPGLVTARGVTYGVFAASMPDVDARNTSDLKRTTEILTSQTDALAKETARVASSIETAKQANAQKAYQDGQNSLLSKIAEASSYVATLGTTRTSRATQTLLSALNDVLSKARDLSTKSSQSQDEQKSLGTQMSDMANQIDQALQALKTEVENDDSAASSTTTDPTEAATSSQAPAQQNTQQSQRSADAAYVCRQGNSNIVRYVPSNGWTLDGARQDAASKGYTSCQVQGTW